MREIERTRESMVANPAIERSKREMNIKQGKKEIDSINEIDRVSDFERENLRGLDEGGSSADEDLGFRRRGELLLRACD